MCRGPSGRRPPRPKHTQIAQAVNSRFDRLARFCYDTGQKVGTKERGVEMQKRMLGKTGEMLTVVGFGGILVMNEEQPVADRLVARAVEELGINYFDVAPSYGDAEIKLGPALEPYRKQVFLACKTGERLAEGAQRELDQSLRRLRTDHVDLYQFHAVSKPEDVAQITGPGGALEVFLKAREQGKARYLGFSAHSEDAAIELMKHLDFDSVLYPVNWTSWLKEGFGPKLFKAAQEKGMGILALKAMAKRRWQEGEPRKWPKCWYSPVDTYEEAVLGLRFTLSKGVTAAVSPGHAQFLEWMCEAEKTLTPLTAPDEAALAERAHELAAIFPQVR